MKRQLKKLTLVVLRRPFITPVIVMLLEKKEAERHLLGAHKFSCSLSFTFRFSLFEVYTHSDWRVLALKRSKFMEIFHQMKLLFLVITLCGSICNDKLQQKMGWNLPLPSFVKMTFQIHGWQDFAVKLLPNGWAKIEKSRFIIEPDSGGSWVKFASPTATD